MSNQNLSEFDIQEAIKDVANLMGVAARTAPKSAGKDFVVVKAWIAKAETMVLSNPPEKATTISFRWLVFSISSNILLILSFMLIITQSNYLTF